MVKSLTRNVAVLDDVVEDRRVAVVLRRPSDLQRAAADARQVDGGRRGWHIFWNEAYLGELSNSVKLRII